MMLKTALYSLLAVLGLSLIASLSWLIYLASKPDKLAIEMEKSVEEIKKELQLSWTKDMAALELSSERAISTELFLHLDLELSADFSKKKYYELVVDRSDHYSQFCVRQTLAKEGIKYFMISSISGSNIVLNTDSLAVLKNTVSLLQALGIKSSFKEIWL